MNLQTEKALDRIVGIPLLMLLKPIVRPPADCFGATMPSPLEAASSS